MRINNRYRRRQRLHRNAKVLAFTLFLVLVGAASGVICVIALKTG